MAEYGPPLRDVNYVLDHLVDLDGLCDLPEFAGLDADTIKGVLEENARFVAEVIAPLNRIGDTVGSIFEPATNSVRTPDGFIDAYRQYVDAGWGGVPFPEVYDGGGFPWLVGIVMQEFISSANMAFSMAPLLTQGAIDLLMHHGNEEQKEKYLKRMVTGEWTGTMNLTEPQAGSDVGAVRTKAVPHGDGTYRITGTKIYISFGEHDMAGNIVHLVLARTPDAPAGTKGISCFIVPKFLVNDDGSLGTRNDVKVVSIEHKMGIHGSPTCVMAFGDQNGAVGYLVGEANMGLAYMFTMMNHARLNVGVQGVALSDRACQQAVNYAKGRVQGQVPGVPGKSAIIHHPDVRRMLMLMRALTEASRALCYVTSAAFDHAHKAADAGLRASAQVRAELLTPLSKAWSTEVSQEVTSIGVQVHGGMGFIEETGAAQLMRDARITTIYEGTTGIQANDLIGRKVIRDQGAGLGSLLARLQRRGV